MQLPSKSNLAGGIAGVVAFAALNLILPGLGIAIPVAYQGLVSMGINVAVTHIIEKFPSVAGIDSEIKDVASLILVVEPVDPPILSASIGQSNANFNRPEGS